MKQIKMRLTVHVNARFYAITLNKLYKIIINHPEKPDWYLRPIDFHNIECKLIAMWIIESHSRQQQKTAWPIKRVKS